MLATIVSDTFIKIHTHQIADALDRICSPRDEVGWASTGMYCFWNPEDSKLLYLGFTKDLSRRFREHLGLVPCDAANCKKNEIEKYFEINSSLGFSVFLQSKLDPRGASLYGLHFTEFENGNEPNFILAKKLLIEDYKFQFGDLPKWNVDLESPTWQQQATVTREPILQYIKNVNVESPFLSNLSLRDLSDDKNNLCIIEELELHFIRLLALSLNCFKMALEVHLKIQKGNPRSQNNLARPRCINWIQQWCEKA